MRLRLLGLAAALVLASCRAAGDPAEPLPPLTILSYNIHHGEGTDGVFDLERLAAVIRASGADLVALQEVDVGTGRASGVDQAAELGRLTGMKAFFGEAIPFSGGSYGDAVLSRWPLASQEAHLLPAQPDHERRVAVAVTVQPPGWPGPLRFVGTHLDHTRDPADRIAQAEALNALLLPDELPTILAGDLNAEPGSAPMRVLRQAGWLEADAAHLPTFPSAESDRKIDWVLVGPGFPLRGATARVLAEPIASDHAPLLVTLQAGEVARP